MFLQFTMMESQINKESGFLNAILDLGKPTIALCCYLNVNGAIRNLSLNTPTATIFLQFNYFSSTCFKFDEPNLFDIDSDIT